MKYSVQSYGDMVRDSPRVRAYADALRDAITPGCTVLDIGAGFGFFSILACRYGAGRVIAVEPAEAITLGPELARANGCADRIRFVQGLSSELGPEDQADVVIADLRGVLPLFKQHIPVIADARARLLAPGGTLITQSDTLRCALLSDGKIAADTYTPWDSDACGLDLAPGRRLAVNTYRKVRAMPEALITDVRDLATLDYREAADPNVSGTVTLVADRAGPVHGLLLWFDATLAGGHSFTNAPGAPELVYGQSFFPFLHPVEMAAGDRAEVTMSFRLVGTDYTVIWRTRLVRAGEPDLRFSQSTALSDFVTPAALRRRGGGHAPEPSPRAELDRHCLSRFDGETTLETIAREAMERAPGRFADETEARGYVADLADRYREG